MSLSTTESGEGLRQIFVPKTTHSYADALLTLGLADLLVSFGMQGLSVRKVTINDRGVGYEISLEPGLDLAAAANLPVRPGYPYIKLTADDPNLPPSGDVIDYEDAKTIEARYREFEQATSKKTGKKLAAGVDDENKPQEPRPDMQVLKVFNSMRMGSNAYNQLHAALRKHPGVSGLVVKRLQRYFGEAGEGPTKDEDAALTAAVSTLQLFNPVAGKGTHRPKPDGTGLGGFPDQWVDWFQEWMKFRGIHMGLAAYRVDDDTKILVLAPGDIAVSEMIPIRQKLLQRRLWGSIKLDILAALALTESLIERSEEFAGPAGTYRLGRRRPNAVLRGFYSTYFKSLGTASAVMNVSFIGLPGWLRVGNREDAEALLEIIAEHRGCLASLDEGRSSDIPLLEDYRNHLSTGSLMDLLAFLARYGAHVIQAREQGKQARQFTTTNLGRLLMAREDLDLNDIVEKSEGFRNLATAIRKATVSAQYRKARGNQVFEVHYGLAQEWKRKVKFKDEFVVTLSDFVWQYNQENARHAEQKKEPRKNISTEDLDQVIVLIDKHGSELVGMLLLAYGYAREPREDDGDQ